MFVCSCLTFAWYYYVHLTALTVLSQTFSSNHCNCRVHQRQNTLLRRHVILLIMASISDNSSVQSVASSTPSLVRSQRHWSPSAHWRFINQIIIITSRAIREHSANKWFTSRTIDSVEMSPSDTGGSREARGPRHSNVWRNIFILQKQILGQIGQLLRLFKCKKKLSAPGGFAPDSLTRGSAPRPRWGPVP